MDCTIDCIGIYVLEIRLVFGIFIVNLSTAIEFYQLVLMSFIFNENRIVVRSCHVSIL